MTLARWSAPGSQRARISGVAGGQRPAGRFGALAEVHATAGAPEHWSPSRRDGGLGKESTLDGGHSG